MASDLPEVVMDLLDAKARIVELEEEIQRLSPTMADMERDMDAMYGIDKRRGRDEYATGE
jgi:hypothetical protein